MTIHPYILTTILLLYSLTASSIDFSFNMFDYEGKNILNPGTCKIYLIHKPTHTTTKSFNCTIIHMNANPNITGTYKGTPHMLIGDTIEPKEVKSNAAFFLSISIPYERSISIAMQANASFIMLPQFITSGFWNNVYHPFYDRSGFVAPVVDIPSSVNEIKEVMTERWEVYEVILEVGHVYPISLMTMYQYNLISVVQQYIVMMTFLMLFVFNIVKTVDFVKEKGCRFEVPLLMNVHIGIFSLVGFVYGSDMFVVRGNLPIPLMFFLLGILCLNVMLLTLLNIFFFVNVFGKISRMKENVLKSRKVKVAAVSLAVCFEVLMLFGTFLMAIASTVAVYVYVFILSLVIVLFLVLSVRLVVLYFSVVKYIALVKDQSSVKSNALNVVRFYLWFTPTSLVLSILIMAFSISLGNLINSLAYFYEGQVISLLLLAVPYFVLLGSRSFTESVTSSGSKVTTKAYAEGRAFASIR